MKINNRVLILREAIKKVVPMLAQRRVEVRMQGMKASVEYDPKTLLPIRVNLPFLPDDCSDELIAAVQGFLDHEVAHILFSDPQTLVEAHAKGENVRFLANAIEDTYIERKMADAFTGSAYNLANTSNFFLKEMVTPNLKVAKNKDDKVAMLSSLMVPAIRAWSGQPEFRRFMDADGKWDDIEDFTRAVGRDLIDRVGKCETSRDCLDLAIEIDKRVNEPTPPPPPPPPKPESGSGKPEPGEPGEGEGEAAPAPAEEGEDPSEGESEPGDIPNLEPEMNSKGIPNYINSAIKDAGEFDEEVAKAIGDRAMKESDGSEYLIFTMDDDKVDTVQETAAGVAGIAAMAGEVDEMLGPIQKDLERAIAAKSAAVWTSGHKRGRLHSAALTRAQFGAVDLFRRKQLNVTKDVAAQLVVDCSGSMCSNGKIKTACYTAFALASVLERLGIPVEVVGFTTRSMSAATQAALRADPKFSEYARYEALNILIFKAFNERMVTDVKARFSTIPLAMSVCNSNVDGESVLLVSRRLLARKETRKVQIVLSDGRPAAHGHGNFDDHLKSAVKMITGAGVDVVGIGICDASVKKYYPRATVMNTVQDLPALVMGELKALLMK